jgi:ATP-dependent DNA helicase RecG
MDEARVRRLVEEGESLTVDFKSDIRRPVNDPTIYGYVVCFADSEGGVLLIGVEDDGRITGARFRHDGVTNPAQLQASIFNSTEPRLNTRVSVFVLIEGDVIAIKVDPYPEVCVTGAGVCLHRVMTTDGPSC